MTQTGETPGLVRKVSPGQLSVTIHDLDDGFGGGGGACREYTRPRDDDCSVPVGWIRAHTQLGPVRQGHIPFGTIWNSNSIKIHGE